MMDSIPIEVTIDSNKNTRLSRTILEQINKDFTYILNTIIKKIEVPQRTVLYLK